MPATPRKKRKLNNEWGDEELLGDAMDSRGRAHTSTPTKRAWLSHRAPVRPGAVGLQNATAFSLGAGAPSHAIFNLTPERIPAPSFGPARTTHATAARATLASTTTPTASASMPARIRTPTCADPLSSTSLDYAAGYPPSYVPTSVHDPPVGGEADTDVISTVVAGPSGTAAPAAQERKKAKVNNTVKPSVTLSSVTLKLSSLKTSMNRELVSIQLLALACRR
ncbi:hypothetical protein C8Q73DRAFT_796370 [Cubamyces lactineus]|nr:hypothetical protein C8Q73DRAFT_796370 [Cubamyces lactineus]